MKIAGLFSAESLMSLALTTTYENSYFQRSIGPFPVSLATAKPRFYKGKFE
jgi:hypothetical protein